MTIKRTYIIDRDEREIGGDLVRVQTEESFAAIKKEWNALPPDNRADVTLFLGRIEPVTGSVTTMACK